MKDSERIEALENKVMKLQREFLKHQHSATSPTFPGLETGPPEHLVRGQLTEITEDDLS